MVSSRMPRPVDDKLTTLLGSIPPSSTYFSLEFFPPKTQAGFTNLQARLARMTTAFRPLFVTVTWGAGGSTATKSMELAEICQRQLAMPTVLHLTCTNMSQKLIDEALEECREVGIRNILALRGDPPREEYKDPVSPSSPKQTPAEEEEFVWAIDLVRYIRRKYGDYFCIGVAGYPEGHADESHPEAACPSGYPCISEIRGAVTQLYRCRDRPEDIPRYTNNTRFDAYPELSNCKENHEIEPRQITRRHSGQDRSCEE